MTASIKEKELEIGQYLAVTIGHWSDILYLGNNESLDQHHYTGAGYC
jgi:hypothetical protein